MLIAQGPELAANAGDVQFGPEGLREGKKLRQGVDDDDRP